MAVDKIRRTNAFMIEKKELRTISGNYLRGDVSKDGYTPVGIMSIDGTGIASTNTIRLFYISGDGSTANVYFHETPSSGSYATVTILYQRDT